MSKAINDNHTADVEPLYFDGDKRIASLIDAIEEAIYGRAETQKIPFATVLGALEVVKHNLLKGLSDE